MDKVAVSRAVARLLERGLLQREIHGDDRRRSVLRSVGAGYRIYDEVAPLALAYERRLLGAAGRGRTRCSWTGCCEAGDGWRLKPRTRIRIGAAPLPDV